MVTFLDQLPQPAPDKYLAVSLDKIPNRSGWYTVSMWAHDGEAPIRQIVDAEPMTLTGAQGRAKDEADHLGIPLILLDMRPTRLS